MPPPADSPSEAAAGASGPRLRARLRALTALADPAGDTLEAHRLRYVRLFGLAAALTALVWAAGMAALGLWPRAGIATVAAVAALGLCHTSARWPQRSALALSLLALAGPLSEAMVAGGLSHPVVWMAVFGIYAAGVTTDVRTTLALGGLCVMVAGALFVRALSASAEPALALLVFVIATALAGFAGRVVAQLTERSLGRLAARAAELGGELTTSEARYRDLADRLPIGFFRSTPDGRYVMANAAMADIIGVDSPEVLCTLGALPFHRDAETRRAFVDEIERTGAVSGFLLDWQRLDGSQRTARLDARALTLPDGERVYEGTAQDVTDERLAQRALAAVQARQTAILDAVSDAVLMLANDGRITFASPAVSALTGRAPAEVCGRPLSDLVDAASRASTAEHLRQALSTDGTPPTLAVTLAHADGHSVLAEGVWSAARPDGGRVVSFRDVTERKRAEVVLQHARERAEEGARLKNALLANVSHEIRTPLTAILGFSEILAAEIGQSEHREFVDLISESGERLMGTLSSVIDLAQLDAGQVRLDATPTRLAETVLETTRALRATAEAKGLALILRTDAPHAEAGIDPDGLERVLRHLIGNAVKFTERGSVTVTVRSRAGRAFIDVADTGIGISEAFLPRLFEAFEQESSGSGRDFEGAGVGLAVSRRLVERMGGEIAIGSRKGVGTTVTISFLRTDRAPAEPAEGERPLALVLDDNPQAKFVAERLLVERYRVRSARSAGSLLALADELAAAGTPAAIALLDIHLGTGPTGDDVMRALRSRPAYAEAPILAVTAYALPGDRARFLAAGFDGYITKPYTRTDLDAAVDRAVEARGGVPPRRSAGEATAAPASTATWVSRPAPRDPTGTAPPTWSDAERLSAAPERPTAPF